MIHERHWPAFHVAVAKPILAPTKEPIGAGAMPSSEPGALPYRLAEKRRHRPAVHELDCSEIIERDVAACAGTPNSGLIIAVSAAGFTHRDLMAWLDSL